MKSRKRSVAKPCSSATAAAPGAPLHTKFSSPIVKRAVAESMPQHNTPAQGAVQDVVGPADFGVDSRGIAFGKHPALRAIAKRGLRTRVMPHGFGRPRSPSTAQLSHLNEMEGRVTQSGASSRKPTPAPANVNGEAPAVGGNATRVSRLLRDARACVQTSFRPETPLDYLLQGSAAAQGTRYGHTSHPSVPASSKRGLRLAALPSPSVDSSGVETVPKRLSSASPVDQKTYVTSLMQVESNAEKQMLLLRELIRWLANPSYRLWPEVVHYLNGLLRRTCLPGATDNNVPDAVDPHVGVVVASVLLHNTALEEGDVLLDVVSLLRSVVEAGSANWLEHEMMFEPLLHILRSDVLLKTKPEVLCGVLEILKQCSYNAPENETIMMQLVTLGVIPTANALAKRIIDWYSNEAADVDHHGASLAPLNLLSPLFLLYRNISVRFANHLRKLGTLDIVVCALTVCKENGTVVEAAARTLAKVVHDSECLAYYQQSTRVIQASLTALVSQLAHAEMHHDGNPCLLVSRLCCTMARVAEGQKEEQDYIVQHGADILVELVLRYVTPEEMTFAGTTDHYDEERVEVVRSIMWLLGMAAMSPHCSYHFVKRIVPMLINVLRGAELTPMTRLPILYTLMCVSNFSYFFALLEQHEGLQESGTDDPATLANMFLTLGPIAAGFLFDGDVEATVEATRILGNMSFTNAGRDWIEENRCDEAVILFLGHEDLRVVYNCFGVVLNLTATTTSRVVEEAELLSLLLQFTGRYTRREDIDTVAATERRLLLERRAEEESPKGCDGGASRVATDAEMLAEQEAERIAEAEVMSKAYAEQIADLVEKVLLNVKGLLAVRESDGAHLEDESYRISER